jgi:nucleoside-diphosphate-sugar epimerase
LRFPLPFKGIRNKRSLIGIDNVVDLIIRCIECPNAAGKIFLASDGKDLSTPELIKIIASAMGQSIKLFSFPISLLKFFGFIFRKQNEIDRLTGSLQIDISHTKKILNWTPPVSTEEGIRRMVQNK